MIFHLLLLHISTTAFVHGQTWINCFGSGNNAASQIASHTNVTKDKLDRHLTPNEEQTLPIHQKTTQSSTWYSYNEPTALFVIGAPASGKTSGFNFIIQNTDLFGIKLNQGYFHFLFAQKQNKHTLDAVIIDGDDWREANEDTLQLRKDLFHTQYSCKDYYDIVKAKGKLWKNATLQRALTHKQNVIYTDTLLDCTAFMNTLQKFIDNNYNIKMVIIMGDATDVIQRGQLRSIKDHRQYDTKQYYASVHFIHKLVNQINSYSVLLSEQITIVYNQKHTGLINGEIPLPQRLSFADFEDLVTRDKNSMGTLNAAVTSFVTALMFDASPLLHKWKYKLIAQNNVKNKHFWNVVCISICIGIGIIIFTVLITILVYRICKRKEKKAKSKRELFWSYLSSFWYGNQG